MLYRRDHKTEFLLDLVFLGHGYLNSCTLSIHHKVTRDKLSIDLSVMLICVFISLFQCTQAEAQLQASEKRLAEILEKEAGNLQEGSSFVHCYSFLQCNTVSNTYVLGVAT